MPYRCLPCFARLPSLATFATSLLLLSGPLCAQARTINLMPGSSFEAAVESLQPGDTLVVHAGTYSDSGRISISARGTDSAPVLIKAADGQARPVITRPAGAPVQNTINIEGATHLTIRGLEITGNGGDGINLSGGPAFITLEDLDIHDVDVGVNFRSSMNNITVRRNQIRRTGIGNGTGEGMYVGCNDATCVVRDSVLENNWIHDALPGTSQGDGIEVKVGSHSNRIRHNVIYNMPYPGIFVYGTGANPANVVEGNVIWNCYEGIYAVADAVVRNNIVIGSGTGLSLYSHVQVAQMKNVTAVNNTLYDNNSGLYLRWGSGVSSMVLANNAVYSPGKTAVNAGGSIGASAIVLANYVQGGSSIALDSTHLIDGGNAAAAFVNAPNKDFWPRTGSVLRDRGADSHAAANDFNSTARVAPTDVGAYETRGLAANPGWRIGEGFKVASVGGGADGSAPSVSISEPSAGAGELAGLVPLTAAAADNVAVASVQFKLDGADLGTELTGAPYTMDWDSTSVANGTHSLTAVARDSAGNTSTSSPLLLAVANLASGPAPAPNPGTGGDAASGGEGGCTSGSAHGLDPLLLIYSALSALVLAWRRVKGMTRPWLHRARAAHRVVATAATGQRPITPRRMSNALGFFASCFSPAGSASFASCVPPRGAGSIDGMPTIVEATDLTRTFTAHSGSHAIFGSLGRGGCARFSSWP